MAGAKGLGSSSLLEASGVRDTVTPMRNRLALPAFALIALAGCARTQTPGWQGYLEGEFVYVASPFAGRLETLAVLKGAQVAKGAPLFTLEHAAETAALGEAEAQLRSAEARLADLEKGSRPTELAALEARLGQARSAAALSQLDLVRAESLFKEQAVAASDYDHARLSHEESVRQVDQLTAELATARLGGRADAVTAARAETEAARAALARARWSLDQKSQAASQGGLVYDTLYREGEFVAAGNPVLAILPPQNLKVRFFVSEADFAALKAGGRVLVDVPGRPAPLSARISYLSPQPEYTPPILYNRDNRAKLVFMIEAVFDGAAAGDLHPGQPVDVRP